MTLKSWIELSGYYGVSLKLWISKLASTEAQSQRYTIKAERPRKKKARWISIAAKLHFQARNFFFNVLRNAVRSMIRARNRSSPSSATHPLPPPYTVPFCPVSVESCVAQHCLAPYPEMCTPILSWETLSHHIAWGPGALLSWTPSLTPLSLNPHVETIYNYCQPYS